MSIYQGAVKRPIMTSLCFVAVMVFGLFSLQKLPIDLYPNIETNTIMVMMMAITPSLKASNLVLPMNSFSFFKQACSHKSSI